MTTRRTVNLCILCPKCDSMDLIIKENNPPLAVFKCGDRECGMEFYAYISYLPIPKFLLRQHAIKERSIQLSKKDLLQEFLEMPVSPVIM